MIIRFIPLFLGIHVGLNNMVIKWIQFLPNANKSLKISFLAPLSHMRWRGTVSDHSLLLLLRLHMRIDLKPRLQCPRHFTGLWADKMLQNIARGAIWQLKTDISRKAEHQWKDLGLKLRFLQGLKKPSVCPVTLKNPQINPSMFKQILSS